MRLTQLFGLSMSLSFVLLAACGDDGGKPKIVDAPGGGGSDAPMADAPHTCLLPATIPMGTVKPPMPGMFILKDAQSGTVFFGIKVYLDANMKTDIGIIVPRPMTGFTPGTVNLDGTGGFAFLEGGLDTMGANPTQSYDNTDGSITFTAIGQTANSPIKGTLSATNFGEVDDMDNPIAGGCTSMLAGMAFDLVQSTTVSAPVGPSGHPESWKVMINGVKHTLTVQ